LEPNFWLATRDYWEKNRIHIERAFDLWQDDKSREIFLQLVDLRLSGDLQLLCAPDMEYQYFPADIAPPRQPLRFVDGGAFIGDTLGATISRFEVEKIAAFEPDSSHFRVLDHWVKKNGLIAKTSLYQSGLGFKRSKKRFQQTGDASSAFSCSGDDMVEVVALDEVLDGFAPNFIKLDIEGAEVEALKGGENVIRRHGPRIAACVYHLPSHLWEVPLLLRHLLPSHTLHLRYHGFNGFDAVAYAIENEKRDF
jgi:FkbM family methyltransferase